MFVSFSHNLLFLHVQRTGGSSVIRALRPIVGDENAPRTRWNRLITTCGLRRNPRKVYLRTHEKAATVRRKLPPTVYDQMVSAAFVRNPYSWLVSLYCKIHGEPKHRHYKHAVEKNFSAFIDWEIKRNRRSQYALVCDKQGRIIVDFLGRLENIQNDFQRLCDLLNLEPPPLPHAFARTQGNWRDYYNDAIREKVATHWKTDLDLFGYDFDGVLSPDTLEQRVIEDRTVTKRTR